MKSTGKMFSMNKWKKYWKKDSHFLTSRFSKFTDVFNACIHSALNTEALLAKYTNKTIYTLFFFPFGSFRKVDWNAQRSFYTNSVQLKNILYKNICVNSLKSVILGT